MWRPVYSKHPLTIQGIIMSSETIYHPTNYRKNIITYWRQWYPNWNIPTSYHVHHITPRYVCKQQGIKIDEMNHPSNLITLHPDDHVSIHRHRGDHTAASLLESRFTEQASHKYKMKIRCCVKVNPTVTKDICLYVTPSGTYSIHKLSDEDIKKCRNPLHFTGYDILIGTKYKF